MHLIFATVLFLLGYIFGSCSSAVIVAKIFNLNDPRSSGSNNPGATNMMRLYGKKYAVITLIGDVLKAFIPLIIASVLLPNYFTPTSTNLLLGFLGLGAFIGHLYPIFFQFKGGKGVATMFGVLAVFDWPLCFITLIIWTVVAKLFKISSLAAILSLLFMPIYSYYTFIAKQPNASLNSLFYFSCVIAIFSLYKHKKNISRLLKGEELIFSKK